MLKTRLLNISPLKNSLLLMTVLLTFKMAAQVTPCNDYIENTNIGLGEPMEILMPVNQEGIYENREAPTYRQMMGISLKSFDGNSISQLDQAARVFSFPRSFMFHNRDYHDENHIPNVTVVTPRMIEKLKFRVHGNGVPVMITNIPEDEVVKQITINPTTLEFEEEILSSEDAVNVYTHFMNRNYGELRTLHNYFKENVNGGSDNGDYKGIVVTLSLIQPDLDTSRVEFNRQDYYGFPAKWWLQGERTFNGTTITFNEWGEDLDDIHHNAKASAMMFARLYGPKASDCAEFERLVDVLEIGNEAWHYEDSTIYHAIVNGMIDGFETYYADDPTNKIKLIPASMQGQHLENDEIPAPDSHTWKDYLSTRIPADKKCYLEGINLHPYPGLLSDTEGTYKERLLAHPEQMKDGKADSKIHYIRNAWKWAHDNMPGKKMYVTEFGWDVTTYDNCEFNDGVGIGEVSQALYTLRSYLLMSRYGVDQAAVYELVDDYLVCGYGYHSSGMYDENLNKRTAMDVLEKFIKQAGDKKFYQVIKEEENGTHAYILETNGTPTHMIAWNAQNTNYVDYEYSLTSRWNLMKNGEEFKHTANFDIVVNGQNYQVDGTQDWYMIDNNIDAARTPAEKNAFYSNSNYTLSPIPVIVPISLIDNNAPCSDMDQDGICDDEDNCPNTPNPSQEDLNNDGIGDVCQPTIDECYNMGGDMDQDGICDSEDNCPFLPNPLQEDEDGNGIGDVCQAPDPCEGNGGDADGDGICDDIDNCLSAANPSQGDYNNDGIGDMCDPDVVQEGGCDAITVVTNTDGFSVSGLIQIGKHGMLQVFDIDNSWELVYSCSDNCLPTETLNLPNGNYKVKVNLYNVDEENVWTFDCEFMESVTINGGSNINPCQNNGGDNDNDGICDDDDNCPNTYNPGQEDNDNDGVGNDCDTDNTDDDDDTDDGDSTNTEGCDAININTTADNNLSISGHIQNNKITVVQVFDTEDGWTQVYNCSEDCSEAANISLPSSTYKIKITLYDISSDGGWIFDCILEENVVIGGNLDPCENNGGDSDNDGICDDNDNCPNTYNPGQEDDDNDGIGNTCDSSDPCENSGGDSDNDGICDDNDNCPNTYNPGQEDNDNDGIGNDCDSNNSDNEDDSDDGDSTITEGCDAIEINTTDNNLSISGHVQDNKAAIVQVFDTGNGWTTAYECSNDNCNETESIALPNSTYKIKISLFDVTPNGWNINCQLEKDIVINGENNDDPCSNNNGDTDEDGVCDDEDNCPDVYNPNQADDDNDGIGNNCEINAGGGSNTGGSSTQVICEDVTMTINGGNVQITGHNTAPIAKIWFFDSNWTRSYLMCDNNCEDVININNLPSGDYIFKLELLDNSWELICGSHLEVNINADGQPTYQLDEDEMIITNVAPNPATDYAFAEITSPTNETLEFVVRSLEGEILVRTTVEITNGYNRINLDINALPEGMYYMQDTRGFCEPVKFVKVTP